MTTLCACELTILRLSLSCEVYCERYASVGVMLDLTGGAELHIKLLWIGLEVRLERRKN
jgi:hypothetical protein